MEIISFSASDNESVEGEYMAATAQVWKLDCKFYIPLFCYHLGRGFVGARQALCSLTGDGVYLTCSLIRIKFNFINKRVGIIYR